MPTIHRPDPIGMAKSVWSIFRGIENEEGLLILNSLFRMAALILLSAYFFFHRPWMEISEQKTFSATLIFFLAYNVISIVVGTLKSEWFLTEPVKFAQALIEIAFYSGFYLQTQEPRSEVFFFFFLPLFVSVRFLNIRLATLVILFAIACLGIVLLRMETAFQPEQGTVPLFSIFLLRALFIAGMTLFYALRGRLSLLSDLREDNPQLASVLKSVEDGIFFVDLQQRLIFVNDALQARHGLLVPGRPCREYFKCSEEVCEVISAIEKEKSDTTRIQALESVFIDQNGGRYPVEITACPLPDEDGKIVGAIVSAKDLEKPRKVAAHLREQAQHYARRVKLLDSLRSLWLETFYELSNRLTSFNDISDLMQFVVEETRTRLRAETSSLFLLDNGVLHRKAIAGCEADWLPNESYPLGKGITSQAVKPEAGLKYGRPQRRNNVALDPEVILEYLAEYRQKMGTHEVRHLLAVPLNGQINSFGVLRVVNKLEGRGQLSDEGFNQEDEDFLVAIASMVAIAIENTLLLSETKQRLQEISTLYKVSQSIAKAVDLKDLLQVIVEEARKTLIHADKVSIHIIQEETDSLLAEATSEAVPSRSGLPPMRLDDGIAGRAILEKRLVCVPDTRQDQDYLDRGRQDLISMLVVPLMIGERVTGVISVDSRIPNAFGPADQALLEALATQAAHAIENARLYWQEQGRRRQADTLLQVSQVVNASLDLPELLGSILDELGKVVSFDSLSFQLVEGDHLKVIACRGFEQNEKVLKLSFPLDDPKYPNYHVLTNKLPLVVADIQESYPHFKYEKETYLTGRINSWMGIPLIHRGAAIGMLAFDHFTPNYYTPEMTSLAQTFANQVAIAIVNARLFQEKQHEMDKLDRLFQVSTVITSSLELTEVLGKIVRLADEVAHSDYTGVVLLGEDGQLFTSVESRQVGKRLHLRARLDGVTWQVIRSKKPVFHADIQDGQGQHNFAITQYGFRSYAGLPIIASDKVLGVLFVHSFQPDVFSAQQALLETFCNQAAIAIENASLYQRATVQAAMLSKLVETSEGLIKHVSMEDLLAFSTKQAARIFNVEDCSLYLKNNERQTVDLVASSTIPKHIFLRRDSPLEGPGLTPYVARTRETLNFRGGEVRRHPAWAGHFGQPFLEHLNYLPSKKCHSLMLGPVEDSQGNCVGVLKLENRCGEGAGKAFTDFEVAMHKTLASHIGMAIERARLYQRLNSEARREAREALGYDLHEISNFIHGALIMRMEVAKEKMERNNCAGVKEELERMSKAASNVHSLLRWIHYDLRTSPVLQEQGLIPALEQIARLLHIPLSLQIKGRSRLPVDVEYALYKVGLEALNNITKHAGSNITARIGLEKDEEAFDFYIHDDGYGFRTEDVLTRPDTYGLNTMERWANSIEAELKIVSQPEQGTQIQVRGKITPGGNYA